MVTRTCMYTDDFLPRVSCGENTRACIHHFPSISDVLTPVVTLPRRESGPEVEEGDE